MGETYKTGGAAPLSGVVYALTTAVTNASYTTTEGIPLTGYTFKKNQLKPGDIIEFYASGQATSTSTPALTFNVYLGTSAILTATETAVAVSSTPWVLRGAITIQSATTCLGYFEVHTAESTATQLIDLMTCDVSADTITATTTDLNFRLEATWDASSASNGITWSQFVVKVL